MRPSGARRKPTELPDFCSNGEATFPVTQLLSQAHLVYRTLQRLVLDAGMLHVVCSGGVRRGAGGGGVASGEVGACRAREALVERWVCGF